MHLTTEELLRYKRQIILKEVGIEGQKKLKNSRVVCVGAGGLGSSLLMYLTCAGVGTIGIIDADHVERTNLHRQVLFDDVDIGQKKIFCAQKKLKKLNPNIEIILHDAFINQENAKDLINSYDIVADCTDNFSAKYAINDVCFYLKKPNVFAGIFQFKGQCSVFTESGPCYRCLYPMPIFDGHNCIEAGVLGVLPGVLGLLQATELIKFILKIGNSLKSKLLVFDALSMHFYEYDIYRDPNCVLCGNSQIKEINNMNQQSIVEVSAEELKLLLQNDQCYLLDVREPEEYLQKNIGGKLIPLKELSNRTNELPVDKLIIVHCKSGKRSAAAVEFLQSKGFTACKSLRGGILAYADFEDA